MDIHLHVCGYPYRCTSGFPRIEVSNQEYPKDPSVAITGDLETVPSVGNHTYLHYVQTKTNGNSSKTFEDCANSRNFSSKEALLFDFYVMPIFEGLPRKKLFVFNINAIFNTANIFFNSKVLA